MDDVTKQAWDKSLDKVKAIFDKQCPGAKCEVWLVGSALNGTEYCDNIWLNVRVEYEYSIEKYHIPLADGVTDLLERTDDYMMLAAGAAIKSFQNLRDK